MHNSELPRTSTHHVHFLQEIRCSYVSYLFFSWEKPVKHMCNMNLWYFSSTCCCSSARTVTTIFLRLEDGLFPPKTEDKPPSYRLIEKFGTSLEMDKHRFIDEWQLRYGCG